MELIKSDIEILTKHLDAAKICGITKMVFTDHKAYGISDAYSACIVSPCELSIPKNVSLGISSVPDFIKRFDAYKESSVVSLDARTDGKVRSISFKTGRSKMSYRCTDASKITYPKASNDVDVGYFELSKAEAVEVKRAISIMMKPDYIYFTISSRGEIAVKLQDQNNDAFELVLEAPFTTIDDSVSSTYNQKFDCKGPLMASLQEFMKSGERIGFIVSEAGNLKAVFDNDVEVTLIPSVTSDDD